MASVLPTRVEALNRLVDSACCQHVEGLNRRVSKVLSVCAQRTPGVLKRSIDVLLDTLSKHIEELNTLLLVVKVLPMVYWQRIVNVSEL